MLPFVKTAYAASHCAPAPDGGFPARIDGGIPGGFNNLNTCDGAMNLDVFIKIVVNLIQIALQFAGIVAVIMLIVGGITYIISRGRPDLMEKAYNTLKYAIVGLVVVILSYVVVYGIDNFIITSGLK
jgi:cytochrome bd-type quinol oxidase subunit 2